MSKRSGQGLVGSRSSRVRSRPLRVEQLEGRLVPTSYQVMGGLEFSTPGTFEVSGNQFSTTGMVQVGLAPAPGHSFTPLLQLDGGVNVSEIV